MDQEVEAGLNTKHVTVEMDTKQKVDTEEKADIATKEKVDMGMEVGRQARQLLQKPLHLNRCTNFHLNRCSNFHLNRCLNFAG